MNKGCPKAIIKLEQLIPYNWGLITVSSKDRMPVFQEGCDNGNISAMISMGWIYTYHEKNIKVGDKYYSDAVEHYIELLDRDDPIIPYYDNIINKIDNIITRLRLYINEQKKMLTGDLK